MYQLLEIIQYMNRTGLSEHYSPIAVWLHQDGFKQTSAACNRARGWYGTKGKCKRGKKTDDVEGIARNSAKESIQSRTGKKKPEKTLKTMFKEADKIGNKYQDPKDVAANKAEIKAIAKAPRKPKAVAAKTVVEKKPIAANDYPMSYDKSLSVFKPSTGREMSYDGVAQDTTNSRIFGARDTAKDWDKYDDETKVNWLEGHAMHVQARGKNDSAFYKRAIGDFADLYKRSSPKVRESIAGQYSKTEHKDLRPLMAKDLESLKNKESNAEAEDKARKLAKRAAKDAAKKTRENSGGPDGGFSDLFG